jgi:hypothetical protein
MPTVKYSFKLQGEEVNLKGQCNKILSITSVIDIAEKFVTDVINTVDQLNASIF